MCTYLNKIYIEIFQCWQKEKKEKNLSFYSLDLDKSLKDTHCQCKVILHWQLIRIIKPYMSYQESEVKWGEMTENMVVIGWKYVKLFYTLRTYSFFSLDK
jgi:hypothetical protein